MLLQQQMDWMVICGFNILHNMKALKTKVNGEWKPALIDHTKVNGVWKDVTTVWSKIAGKWVNDLKDITFEVTEKGKREFVFRPEVGDFVYGDKTWSRVLNPDKTCVGIITDVGSRSFDFVALEEGESIVPWRGQGTLISNIVTTNDIAVAELDFKGKHNTDEIISQLGAGNAPAAEYCAQYSTEGFPARSWCLPALGQWQTAYYSKAKIDASMAAANGMAINSNYHWTSTQYSSNYGWLSDWSDGNVNHDLKKNNYRVRAFCTYEYNPVPNGVYIYDKNGDYFTKEEWTTQNKLAADAMGVGVVTDETQFVISPIESSSFLLWGNTEILISNIVTTDNRNTAKLDFKGKHNANEIIAQLGAGNATAAEYCQGDTFANSKKGYLPACGQWQTAYNNKTEINACMLLISGTFIYATDYHWTSTQSASNGIWMFPWSDGLSVNGSKKNSAKVRAFTELPFKGETHRGTYILGTDNELYTKEEWATQSKVSSDAVGVAVVEPETQFVISPTESSSALFWGGAGTVVNGIVTTSDDNVIKNDFKGKYNTEQIVSQLGTSSTYAANYCQGVLFSNGQKGYLGAAGQWQMVNNNKTDVDEYMLLIGGTPLAKDFYPASTQWNSYYHWGYYPAAKVVVKGDKNSSYYTRAFADIIGNIPAKNITITLGNTTVTGDSPITLKGRLNHSYGYTIVGSNGIAVGNTGPINNDTNISTELDTNEGAYATYVIFDDTNPSTELERGGNLQVIEDLTAKFRRCLALPQDDGSAAITYLDPTNGNNWEDGTAVAYDASDEHYKRYMVHFPKYYYRSEQIETDKWKLWISDKKLNDNYKEERECLVGCFEAYIAENKLLSMKGVLSSASRTITSFFNYAQANGSKWGLIDYRAHKTIANLFCAKYGNTNISTNNSAIPCSGGTKSYGDGYTGNTLSLGNIDGLVRNSSSFLGLEDCYYGKWEFVQGINILERRWIVYDGGLKVDTDVAALEAAGYTNVRTAGTGHSGDGYITKTNHGDYADLVPTAVGGSDRTYYADHYYQATGNRVLLRSGASLANSKCGVFVVYAPNDSSTSTVAICSRLTFYGDIVVKTKDEYLALQPGFNG